MGLCDDPSNQRSDVEEQPEIVFEDVSDVDDDAAPQFEDISDAEEAPVEQSEIEYDDISEPDGSAPLAEDDRIEFVFVPYEPDHGQSSSYLVHEQGRPAEIHVLRNWDLPSGSVALWYQYMHHYEQLHGQAFRDQFMRDFFAHGGTMYNFGRIVKETYDILYHCLD